MSTNFTVVGGDLRIIKLTKMLASDGNKVYVYGLEKAEELKENENITICNKLTEAVKNSDIIIGPIPFSSNGKDINTPFSDTPISIRELMHTINAKILIAGSIAPEVYEMANDEYIEIIDIMKREELAVLNTISTAEGAIARAIEDTTFNITNANVLVLGFGNVGKTLCKKLKDAGANVYAEARKQKDLAWIEVYGYTPIHLENLKENVCKMDIVFNTVPYMILDKSTLILMSKETLIIDLASKPGGVDFETAKKLGIKAYLYSGIPGKIAPKTSAEYIVKYVKEKLVE